MINITTAGKEEYNALVQFFLKYDLEFEGDEEYTDDIVGLWKAVDTDNNELAGAIVLAVRDGEFIIDGLAVETKYRDAQLGGKLYKLAEEEAQNRGGDKVFLVAKVPKFWKKTGFNKVDEKDAPNFFECETCDQYKVSCFPEVMKKLIDNK